ncbi:hypothetical protein [Oceanirhabdus sp. W0125-5]|uniref:hypothetical protein n=1 Tax=Oceanirhabdus sp. W0125-5 TaxID=2999116 RepID=UPI0022F2FDB9|nr:hypothetical protein [Oceanirhabdus sp. W0125-5]WBW96478.1 hypothetical protein OW730_22700 [Oceanirhabdus sp. W0125-5]
MKLYGYDPMNIEEIGNEILHKHCICINIDGENKWLLKPVIMEYENNRYNISKITFNTNKKPELKDGSYEIEGIGRLSADKIRILNC